MACEDCEGGGREEGFAADEGACCTAAMGAGTEGVVD